MGKGTSAEKTARRLPICRRTGTVAPLGGRRQLRLVAKVCTCTSFPLADPLCQPPNTALSRAQRCSSPIELRSLADFAINSSFALRNLECVPKKAS